MSSLSCISRGSDNGPRLKSTRPIDERTHHRLFTTPKQAANKNTAVPEPSQGLWWGGYSVGEHWTLDLSRPFIPVCSEIPLFLFFFDSLKKNISYQVLETSWKICVLSFLLKTITSHVYCDVAKQQAKTSQSYSNKQSGIKLRSQIN